MTIHLTLSCLLAAGILLFLAWAFGAGVRKRPGLWKTLPRERAFGTVLALAALAFAAWQSDVLLEGNLRNLIPIIWLLVPVSAVLSFLYLDFLFTRALAGALLLLVPQMLDGARIAHLPLRPAFSAACYALALAAAVAIAAPWIFRDHLERAAGSASVRRGWLWICTGMAAMLLLASLAPLFRSAATP
jgi:hypothetical protein